MRTMFDGITASALPSGAAMVAGYVDGHWPDAPALGERFPHALLVRIAVSASTNDGVVLDVEQGDATPAEAVSWVLNRRHAGVDPTVYCSMSAWPQVKAAFDAHEVPQPHYWVAQYDNVAVLPAGAVAKQFKNTAGWDESVVADYWPGVDPAPKPTEPPAPSAPPVPQEDTMFLYTAPESAAPNAAKQIYALGNGGYKPVPNETIYADLLAAGWVNKGPINFPLHEWLLAEYGTPAVTKA